MSLLSQNIFSNRPVVFELAVYLFLPFMPLIPERGIVSVPVKQYHLRIMKFQLNTYINTHYNTTHLATIKINGILFVK